MPHEGRNSITRKRKRSRNGCLTCKTRKKKCDETKPVCNNCNKLRLYCCYKNSLNWNKQNQQFVNIFTTKVGINEHFKFINFTSSDILVGHEISESLGKNITINPNNSAERETELLNGQLSSWELEVVRNDPDLGPQVSETFLFKLYTDVLSRTKSFPGSEVVRNDFIHIVIPGCRRFPALYCSVLALSALYLIKTESTKPQELQDNYLLNVYNTLFLEYKNDALNYLHVILDNFDIEEVEMLEQLVITIILLCNIEITNKGNQNWTRYLYEASLIFSALSTEKIMSSDIFKFGYKYFSLRYILLLTILDCDSLTLLIEESPWPIINSLFQSNTIESMFGCSPKLLHIIHQTSMLIYSFERKMLEVPQYIGRISRLWYELDYLIQGEKNNNEELIISARCYIYAIKIYIYTSLRRSKLENYLDDDYQWMVPDLWRQLTELSRKKKSLFFPNWCFFVITTNEIHELEESKRMKALNLLDTLEINWPLSSVVQIRRAIIAVWKIYDICVTSVDSDKHSSFDFRNVLSQYNYKLALT